MTWIFVATLSYFLGAITVILDKFLLGSKRISSPPVYAFYVELLGLTSLMFVPFGFSVPSGWQIFLSALSGIFFSMGILFLYFSIQKAEADRVMPVVGAVIPLATYCFSFFVFDEYLTVKQIFGAILLISGGLLISFDFPLQKKRKFFNGFYYALISGIFSAAAYTIFKEVYNEQSFFNGFIWTRLGSFLSVIILFAVPSWRRAILNSFKGFYRPEKKTYNTGALFVSNKIVGGTSSILFNYAISLGNVTLVNSMVSLQYVFVLLLAWFAARLYPKVYEEKLSIFDWMQKIVAIGLVAIGLAFVSRT